MLFISKNTSKNGFFTDFFVICNVMKRLIPALLLVASATYVQAQEKAELSQLGCATITTQEELQRIYDFNRLPPAAFKTTASVDTIPLTIHLVGQNDGSGYYSMEQLFQVLCELNTRFAPVNMYFSVKWPVKYINNSSYYIHNHSNGSNMMRLNNVANTVNVYFVNDPAGACGYFSPGRDAVAIAIKCSAPASTTLTHELGHYFGLPHTFYGWENGNTPNQNDQENVARTGVQANCATAGDGFCDTRADYLGERWSCPYNGTLTDQYGAALSPDHTVYMSYSTDACMTRFTPSQIAYMRNNLYTRRSNLLNSAYKPNPYTNLEQPKIIYPDDLLYANYQKVIWNAVPGAEYYHVKVSVTSNYFSIVRQEALTSDTSLELTFNVVDRASLTVAVNPMMSTNVCGASMSSHPFVATDAHTTLDVADVAASGNGTLRIMPNPVTGGNTVRIQPESLPAGSYQVYLVNMNGQKVLQHTFDYYPGSSSTIEISTRSLPAGMYFLNTTNTAGGQWVEKLIIQN